MGTCCSSRTDKDGLEKQGKGNKSAGGTAAGKAAGGAGVKFNPMDAVRNTVTKVLTDSK